MVITNKIKAWSGVVSCVLAAAVAWHQLGGWVPAGAAEVEQRYAELKSFSKDTRVLLLEDKLWEHRQALRQTKRDIESYNNKSQAAPGWLLQDEVDLERRIDRLQQQINQLRNE